MKRMALFLLGMGFIVICSGYGAEAGTVKFPVEVSINSSAHYLTDTEMFVMNLKSTPVTITFDYYSNNGVKTTCSPIPPSITIQGNESWTLRVGGCFAVALPMPPVSLVGIGEITAPSKSVNVYWRIYNVSGEQDLLLDHGKESP